MISKTLLDPDPLKSRVLVPRLEVAIVSVHRSAPMEKCPECLSLRGPLGDTPPIRNTTLMGPCKDPKGPNTKVSSAKGHFCAYPRQAYRPRENMVGVNVVLAEFIKIKNGLYKSCGIVF